MEEEIAIAGRCPNRFFLNLTGGESPAIVRVYLDSSFRARDIKRTLKMNLQEDRGVDTPRSPNKIPKRNLPPEKSELPWHYTGEIKSTDTKCCRFQTRHLVTFVAAGPLAPGELGALTQPRSPINCRAGRRLA